MKRVLSAVVALGLATSLMASPRAQAGNIEDLGKILFGVGMGIFLGMVISDQMPDDANLGFYMQFNENGNQGYVHYDSEGYGRRGEWRGRQCRRFTRVYTDACGNPIREEVTVECLNRRGHWKVVDKDNFEISRRFQGDRPRFRLCGNIRPHEDPVQRWPQDPWVRDDRWTDSPPMDIFDPVPPTIQPVHPQAPAILPMQGNEPPPAVLPMQPGFIFAPQVAQ